MLIKREASVPDHEGGGAWWSVDHLAVDQDAVPTFVEVKRASDTRARREVVAQMLDYAANGSVFWTPAQLRSWFEGDDRQRAMERLMGLLDPLEGEPDDVADAFWQAVGTNLKEGRIRLVFVAALAAAHGGTITVDTEPGRALPSASGCRWRLASALPPVPLANSQRPLLLRAGIQRCPDTWCYPPVPSLQVPQAPVDVQELRSRSQGDRKPLAIDYRAAGQPVSPGGRLQGAGAHRANQGRHC